MLPAHAGMIRLGYSARTSTRSAPRSRGDDPIEAQVFDGRDVLPAHAGMILWHRSQEEASQRAPRSRGDDPHVSCSSIPAPLCSPLTRG